MKYFTYSSAVLPLLFIGSVSHAAWFKDRDNTMIPAKDEVGRSMVITRSKRSYATGVQVYCPKAPGTILTTAHSSLDDPRKNKKPRSPSKGFSKIIQFPFKKGIHSYASKDSQFHSPIIDSVEFWKYYSKDYIFITPNSAKKFKGKGLKILNMNAYIVKNYIKNNKLKIFLYRPKSKYLKNKEGIPEIDKKKPSKKPSQAYDTPMKVVHPCEFVVYSTHESTTDCPLEKGVSGSPLVLKIGKENFIIGIVQGGRTKILDSFDPKKDSSIFINSSTFCSDYENLYGTTCIDIKDVLPPEKTDNANAATDVEN